MDDDAPETADEPTAAATQADEAPAGDAVQDASEVDPRRLYTMLLASFLVMFIEIVDFSILHYVSHYLQAQAVISVALLGIATGGLAGFYLARRGSSSAYLGAVLLLVGSQVLPIVNFVYFPHLLQYPVALAVPFFALSVLISLVFAQTQVHRAYFSNLAGAALGVVAAACSILWLREENSLVLAIVLSSGLLFLLPDRPRGERWPRVVGAMVVAAGLLLVVANVAFDTVNFARAIHCPDAASLKGKVFCKIAKNPDAKVLHSRGSLVARVDIIKLPKWKPLQTYQGGTISDHVQRLTPKQFSMDARLQKGLLKDPKVLVVGTSAEGITKTARNLGNVPVVGVEINPAIVDLMKPGGPLYKASANAYEGVDVHVEDARGFLRGTDERYDIITFMNTHSRGRVRENIGMPEYLYTVEAFRDVLSHLTERGVAYYEEIRTNKAYDQVLFRFMTTLAQAYREELGVEDISDYLYCHRYRVGSTHYFIFVASRTPLDAPKRTFFEGWMKKKKRNIARRNKRKKRQTGVQDAKFVLFPGKTHTYKNPYARFLTEKKYLTAANDAEFDLTALTDDRPFLFDLDRAHPAVWEVVRSSVWLALLLVILPVLLVFVFRFRDRIDRSGPHFAYFSLLGVGFMLVEVVLIQKYTLFLGSPTTALIVVLGSMMLYAGIGGLVSARFSARATQLAIVAIPVLLLLTNYGSPALFRLFQSTPLPVKVLVTLTALFPLFFCMGVPFPFGLSKVKREFSGEYAALLFGLNGAASTIGSTLSMAISVTDGFSTTFLWGIGAYTGALLLVPLLARQPKGASS